MFDQPQRLLPPAVATAVSLVAISCAPNDNRVAESAAFVGGQVCAECHRKEYDAWSGSHHDLAMDLADDQTVLGDFDGASFTHFGVTSTFFRRDGQFFVRTDGPDGELHDYEIAYTFGVTPLQQYLIAFPDGRYQALGIAWDTRPVEIGGQRWFHLYPDEPLGHDDRLHWTGPNQTWNYMCAECHSTDLRKNYDSSADRYETTWSEIDVSCEACHGPGSRHVTWAEARPDTGASMARQTTPLTSNAQLELCGRCHSRRGVVSEEYEYGRPLLDTHRLSLLEEELYYADGQILEEVYVYGSFIQSKMHEAGVTCSDCHDPHSLGLRAEVGGNSICTRCHAPAVYDTPSHHFHRLESPGAACVECHMPARTYMVVDPRRDHSFRVPRPDLSARLGTPDACSGCHTDQSAEWAAAAVAGWLGPQRRQEPHFGEALYAGRLGDPAAESTLTRLAIDTTQPGIARATAVSLLRGYGGPHASDAIRRSLNDVDPLVRVAALGALEALEPSDRLHLAIDLRDDSMRVVRIQAARVLAPVPTDGMTPAQLAAIDRGIAEYIESQLINADRAESHLNLALLHAERGEFGAAETAYRTALRIDPSFVPAYVNLADLYRLAGRDIEGERLLREALAVDPEDANVHHALGLSLVRQRRLDEALEALGRAAELAPNNSRYTYVYGIALHSTGESERALAVMKEAQGRHPYDRELLFGLATINRDVGALEAAVRNAAQLVELWPEDAEAVQLLQQLESQRDE